MKSIATAFLTITLLSAIALAHEQDRGGARPTDPLATEAGIDQRIGADLPLDAVFVDENGESAALRRYFDGKPILLALVYYNCDRVCPLVLEGLARSLRPLELVAGDDYRVLAISIDPRERPALAREKKAAIAARQPRSGVARGWHLLTAEQPAIDAVARATGFRYAANQTAKESDRYVHPAATMMITPQGKVARYFYGIDYPPRELRLSLVEASGNRIGSAVDQLMLLCYAYDPSQGKYTLAILNVLRLSGAATVLALGSFLVLLLRREHRPDSRSERRFKVQR